MTALAPRYQPPAPSEHAPYYGRYIEQVAGADLLEVLRSQIGEYDALFGGLPESKGDHAYAPGKWSIKEVVGHLIDGERDVFVNAQPWEKGVVLKNDAAVGTGFGDLQIV